MELSIEDRPVRRILEGRIPALLLCVITCDVSVPIAIHSDGLTRVITIGRTIVMPNPKLISIRCVFDRGDIIV